MGKKLIIRLGLVLLLLGVISFCIGGKGCNPFKKDDEDVITGSSAKPDAPDDLSATAVSTSRIDLSWSDSDNADNEDGFEIERKTGSDGSYSQIETVGKNVETYANTGLDSDTTYYYRVRAYNDEGNSDYSNVDSATTEPEPDTTVYIFEQQVVTGTDDCQKYYTGATWGLDIASVQQPAGNSSASQYWWGGGMRFQAISISNNATISTARLSFTCKTAGATTVVNTKIIAEKSANPSTFSDLNNYNTRITTTASAAWTNIPDWTAESIYNSADIKGVIQELVDTFDYSVGDKALVLFWEEDGSTTGAIRKAYSYDGDSTKAPKLYIEYTLDH